MSKGYRAYEQHLQINHTPEEYVTLKDARRVAKGEAAVLAEKHANQLLSRYLVSRCPFCRTEWNAYFDTYSLYDWQQSSLGWGRVVGQAYVDSENESACEHFIAIQRFSNLEGTLPVETHSFQSKLHLPFVMPFYLSSNVPAIAVIHSIPICRIESSGDVYNIYYNRFVKSNPTIQVVNTFTHRPFTRYTPLADATDSTKERLANARFMRRYTAFIVAHYAQDPKRLRTEYVDNQIDDNAIKDSQFTVADLMTVTDMAGIRKKYPEGFDLAHWVEKGKLQWLDLDNPQFDLKAEPATDFPYSNLYDITGEKKHFTYQDGKIFVDKYWG